MTKIEVIKYFLTRSNYLFKKSHYRLDLKIIKYSNWKDTITCHISWIGIQDRII